MMIPEIIDYILGFLRTDRATLKTCSTVFPEIVDRHLYSHITLRTPKIEEDEPDEDIYYVVDFSEFMKQLVERPQIAFWITIIFSLELLPVISLMLPIFRKLVSVELNSVKGSFSWSVLGFDFCTSFQDILRLPSINQVAISNISGFPLDSFDESKNLKKLVLRGQFTDGEGVSTSGSSYPRLSSLCIKSQGASDLTKIVSWMKSNNTLHTLSLLLHQSMDLPKFQPLIEACSATLVSLELGLTAHSDDMSTETVFGNGPQFPALQYLILRTFAEESDGSCFGLSYFVPFLIALSRFSSPNSVHLSLHLQFGPLWMFVRHVSDVDVKWPDITNGLSVFRRPIELHITLIYFSLSIWHLFERSSDIQRLIADGELIMRRLDVDCLDMSPSSSIIY